MLFVIFAYFSLMKFCLGWCEVGTIWAADDVWDVAWSPSGNMIAIASKSDILAVYDSRTFDPLVINDMGDEVYTIKFSSDGSMFGVGLKNSDRVKIWSATAPYSLLYDIDTNHGSVRQIDFHPDNDRILTCGNDDYIKQYVLGSPPTVTHNFTSSNNGDDVLSCKYSTDGYTGAVDAEKDAYLYNTNSGNRIEKIDAADDLTEMVFRPGQHTYIMSSSSDDKVYEFNTQTDSANSINLGKRLYAIDYSSDSFNVATGGESGIIFILNTTNRNNTHQQSLYNDNNDITALRFSANSHYLLSGNSVGRVTVWKRFCGGCQVGTYQSTQRCVPCVEALDGCQICVNSSYCESCFGGYYLDTTTHTCSACTEDIAGCSLCDSSTTCQQCMIHYYLSGGSCLLCDSLTPGCQACTTDGVCIQCSYQYQLNGGNCNDCPSNCVFCEGTDCLECELGYNNTGSGCVPCSGECLVCNIDGCSLCISGYWANSGVCQACDEGCLFCNNTGYCFDCVVGMYPQTGVCTPCTYPCLSCAVSATNCTTCVQGHYFSAANTCTQCTNCVNCHQDTGVCITCSHGFYLTAGDVCDNCTNIHDGCQLCSLGGCFVCENNYVLDGGVCVEISDVANCVSYDVNASSCVLCAAGYYLDAAACVQCDQPCLRCSDSSVCEDCAPGFYVAANACTQCVSPCVTCTSNVLCLSCPLDMYLNGNTCSYCSSSISNCISCVNSTQCSSCMLGYSLAADKQSCTACGGNCASCDDSSCFSCELGYYLDGVVCTGCPSSCTQCESGVLCSACVLGYALQTNQCQKCDSLYTNCKYCDSTACIQCFDGYYEDMGSCVGCSSLINYCVGCNGFVCLLCDNTHSLSADNLTCVECSTQYSNCFSCDTVGCVDCVDGFYQTGGACVQCMTGCMECSTNTVCDRCDSRFVINAGVCQTCQSHIDGCLYCSSTSTCLVCLYGYYLNGASCGLCDVMDGCQQCISGSECIQCGNGFYLDSDSCWMCGNISLGCQVCNRTQCLDCQIGYYLDSGSCLGCGGNTTGCSKCSYQECLDCESGYYLFSGTCQACSAQYEGCIFCNVSQCLQCQSGYELVAGLCQVCGLVGCDVCQSGACLSCDSHYYLTVSNSCQLCSQTSGCFECTSSTQCTICQTGYYLSSNSCYLCEDLYPGCDICTQFACKQCKSNYFLNSSNECTGCGGMLDGCTLCLNSTECLNCETGYYLQNGECTICTNMSGCLMCTSSQQCLYCQQEYYLDSGECVECRSLLEGCRTCISSTVCLSCEGSYKLTGVSCVEIKGTQPTEYGQFKLLTKKIAEDRLQHELYADGGFVHIEQHWQSDVELIMVEMATGQQTLLTIISVQWGANDEKLVFLTNHPKSSTIQDMPFTRLLQFSTQFSIKLNMKQKVINQIYPSLHMDSDFMIDYDLSSPEFYKSSIQEQSHYYFIIGIVFTLLFVGQYVVKLCFTVPKTNDCGDSLTHVFVIKCGALAVYPAYPEYINFCYGWMMMDLPWVNDVFSEIFADASDYVPEPYLMYYTTINICSTCLLAMLVYGVIGGGLAIARCVADQYKTIESLQMLLLNICGFAIIYPSALAFHGAILNPVTSLALNSFFYIIGIGVYCTFATYITYLLVTSKNNFPYFRMLLKVSLISFLHYNPLYLFIIVCIVDVVAIVYCYTLKKGENPAPKVYIVGQCCYLVGLGLLIFMNKMEVGLILVSVVVGIGFCCDVYVHYWEYEESQLIHRLKPNVEKLEKMGNDLSIDSLVEDGVTQKDLFKTTFDAFHKYPEPTDPLDFTYEKVK